jgi:hypothetical protein
MVAIESSSQELKWLRIKRRLRFVALFDATNGLPGDLQVQLKTNNDHKKFVPRNVILQNDVSGALKY